MRARATLFAMDRALRKKGHGFRQPLDFCWSNESCWEEIKDKKPGTVGSEPYLRKQLKAKGQGR